MFLKTEVSQDHIVTVGDQYELHFSLFSYFQDYQVNLLLERIKRDKRYEVVDHWVEGNTLVVTIVIIKNPYPIALIITGILAVSGGIFAYFSLDKIYKITSNPVVSLSVLIIAASFLVSSLLK